MKIKGKYGITKIGDRFFYYYNHGENISFKNYKTEKGAIRALEKFLNI